MKVDNLLGPYLYKYKKLSLPGIGQFILDDKAILPDDNAKVKTPIEGITFSSKTGTVLEDSLIDYVKTEAGKMRPLAEADLYSFIATAFQYLNIGKPFYFEGIGTLQKNKDGNYTFAAGTVISQKSEDSQERYSEPKRKNVYNSDPVSTNKNGSNNNRLILAAGIIITLALIGWGGYYLYNKNTGGTDTQNEVKPAAPQDTAPANTPIADSSGTKPQTPSDTLPTMDTATTRPARVTETASAASLPGGNFKFVLETTNSKARVIKRLTQLKGVTMLKEYNNTVAAETKDSSSFKIYTMVPCTPADTARIKALLNAWYYGGKEMKVKIE